MSDRQLHIGTFIEGIPATDWRDPRGRADDVSNITSFIEFTRLAEAGKLDYGFIADSASITPSTTWQIISRIEPIVALSALSTHTSRIGLAGTVSTSYSRPFDVARQLANLDRVTHGRAGWNVVTSYAENYGRNYGDDRLHAHDKRYAIAEEFVDVVRKLWNSWGDAAFPRDRERDVYHDPELFFEIDHEGEYFKVRGTLNIERSEQGHPVIFQAGASDAGRRLAAKTADAVFSPSVEDRAASKEYYDDIKRRAAEFGRNPDEIFIQPSFSPIVDRTDILAQERYDETYRYNSVRNALDQVSRIFNNFDLSTIDYNGPFPDEVIAYAKDGFTSAAEKIVELSRRENLSIAQAALRSTLPSKTFVGSAERIANTIEELFHDRVLDGLTLTVSKENLDRFIDQVIPILQRRGLFRTDYEASTLRGHFGLPFPENPYETGAAAPGGALPEPHLERDLTSPVR